MGKDEHLIEAEVLSYITVGGGSPSDWFVSLSTNPAVSLFSVHRVVKENDLWIYRKALSEEAARKVVTYFQQEMGTDGNEGEGVGELLYVFAFRKAPHTVTVNSASEW